MPKKLKRTVASFFAQTELQVLLSFALFLVALARAYYIHRAGSSSPEPRQATYVLASIGAVLGLATSVAFGFVIFVLNQANSRKHDLYFRFKSGLFEFDKFLKEYSAKIILVSNCLELSWKLKSLKMSDFPLDWEDLLIGVTGELETLDETSFEDSNLPNKIIGYLVYLEDIVSEIGILCIRQIIAGVHVRTVTKAFVSLAMQVPTDL